MKAGTHSSIIAMMEDDAAAPATNNRDPLEGKESPQYDPRGGIILSPPPFSFSSDILLRLLMTDDHSMVIPLPTNGPRHCLDGSVDEKVGQKKTKREIMV